MKFFLSNIFLFLFMLDLLGKQCFSLKSSINLDSITFLLNNLNSLAPTSARNHSSDDLKSTDVFKYALDSKFRFA